MRRTLALIALAILVTVFHFSILPFFGDAHLLLNLALISALGVTAVFGFTVGALYIVILGILFDQYTNVVPLLWTFSLLGAVGVVHVLTQRYVTQRSQTMVLLLTLVGTLTWAVLFWGGTRLTGFLGAENLMPTWRFFWRLPWQMLVNSLSLFLITLYIRRREGQHALGRLRVT